ncbi:MAG: hypothetical protein ABII88_02685 [Candidatus Omnitrophota bacterium]
MLDEKINMNLNILISTAIGAFIGSSITLLATIISHYLQCSAQQQKEEKEIKGFLQAIHDEIETLWKIYTEGMGNILEATPINTPLPYYYPLTQEYFTIYVNNTSFVSKIEDIVLRKNIVETYVQAKGLIDSYKMNNELVYKYEHSAWTYQETQSNIHKISMDAHHKALIEYAKSLKETHEKVKQKVQLLLKSLKTSSSSAKKEESMNGKEIRAQIDTENVKGLILINGGGAVALLTFLPSILNNPSYEPLSKAILNGLLIFSIGLISALIHNHLRRRCSLAYESSKPIKTFLGFSEPWVGHISYFFMYTSYALFIVAVVLVFLGGHTVLNSDKQTPKENAVAEINISTDKDVNVSKTNNK